MIRTEWRGVIGHEDCYQVSAAGQVRSLRTGAVLKPLPRRQGYLAITLHGREKRLIHQLVIEAFGAPRPSPKHEVRHLDGDPANNAIDNLAWGTRSENIEDTIRHGRHPQAKKTHCPKGHAYTPANTYTTPGRNGRWCRTCIKARNDARPRVRGAA